MRTPAKNCKLPATLAGRLGGCFNRLLSGLLGVTARVIAQLNRLGGSEEGYCAIYDPLVDHLGALAHWQPQVTPHSTHYTWVFNAWFWAGRKSSIFGLWAAPKTIPKPPPSGIFLGAAGVAQTQKIRRLPAGPKTMYKKHKCKAFGPQRAGLQRFP